MRYLDSQLNGRFRDCRGCDKVLNNLKSRLMLWKTCYLLMGGKMVLIKSVICSMPIIQMSVGVFLEGVKRKIHDLIGIF